MRELIGERLPLKAPLGEAYVAWSSAEHVERWLAVAGKDPDLVAMLRQRLTAIRAQGYAAWRMGSAADRARLSELMDEYGAGDLTPARERALLDSMSEAMTFVDTADFSADLTYDIGGLMAPVINRDGSVAMMVRLAQLPQQAPGSVVQHWVAELQAAVASIEASLWNNSPSPDYGVTSALATSL
jgi:DNA-binding IclR family transcriptional regulator